MMGSTSDALALLGSVLDGRADLSKGKDALELLQKQLQQVERQQQHTVAADAIAANVTMSNASISEPSLEARMQ